MGTKIKLNASPKVPSQGNGPKNVRNKENWKENHNIKIPRPISEKIQSKEKEKETDREKERNKDTGSSPKVPSQRSGPKNVTNKENWKENHNIKIRRPISEKIQPKEHKIEACGFHVPGNYHKRWFQWNPPQTASQNCHYQIHQN